MKKHIILICTCLIFIYESSAQSSWQWARSFGNSYSNESVSGADTDSSGNVYIAGNYNGGILTMDSFQVNSFGSNDVFISKLDAFGNVVWSKSAGSNYGDYTWDFDSDLAGNVVVTGTFQTLSFNIDSFSVPNVGPQGNYDIFVAKLDPNGNVLWLNGHGGTSQDWGKSAALDINGNAYVTGFYNGTNCLFDTILMPSANNGSYLFTSKYDTSGNLVWVKSVKAIYANVSNGITTDASGACYITGFFASPYLIFGSDTVFNTSSIKEDLFIAKYDTDGNFIWARTAGGIERDMAFKITTDQFANLYITGEFQSTTINFDNIQLTSQATDAAFLAKLDSSGNYLWVKTVTNCDKSIGYDVVVDQMNNCIVTGIYQDSLVTFDWLTLQSEGESDAFLIKYDEQGNVLTGRNIGGPLNDVALTVAINQAGEVFSGGHFRSADLYFDNLLIQNVASSGAEYNMYIAKLSALTGIETQEHLVHDLRLFPNPGRGQFEVLGNEMIKEIRVFDIQGRQVLSQTVNNNNAQLELDQNGLFFINIVYDDTTITKKYIITNHE